MIILELVSLEVENPWRTHGDKETGINGRSLPYNPPTLHDFADRQNTARTQLSLYLSAIVHACFLLSFGCLLFKQNRAKGSEDKGTCCQAGQPESIPPQVVLGPLYACDMHNTHMCTHTCPTHT